MAAADAPRFRGLNTSLSTYSVITRRGVSEWLDRNMNMYSSTRTLWLLTSYFPHVKQLVVTSSLNARRGRGSTSGLPDLHLRAQVS